MDRNTDEPLASRLLRQLDLMADEIERLHRIVAQARAEAEAVHTQLLFEKNKSITAYDYPR